MSTGAASSAGNVGNLTVPPPGLPGPTVSNAEAAAQLMNLGLYPGFQLNVINPAASPSMPQFYVPNVSSASATSGNQYQRSGGYQQAPALFGNSGYEEMQQMSSQSDYGKQNYGVLQTQGKPTATGGPGSGMALGNNDMSSKYGGGMKVPYDSKQFVPATGTPPPLGNMNYTPTATAPAHYGYPNYFPQVMNMNLMAAPAMPSNAQLPSDLLNQRNVNQNGKPPGGHSNVGKGMTQQQQYQYGGPWGS